MMTRQSKPKVLTIREKILLDGESDWVKLQQVHDYVASENRSESLAEVQRKTLALVRAMTEEGVIALGEPVEHGARFEDWDLPLDDAIARLGTEYIDRFDDRLRWPLLLWFRVTDEGKRIGRAYEPEYDAWLADLRAQGTEYEPLPLHLVPGGNTKSRG
ncbi:hypothetical protein [Mycobacterium sp. SMC-4]|uniref:hypothetical protein n=1 Tax=Mycobacterium sp. SMC-4 TaxID=2857059 RepID=UPI003D0367F6